MPRRRQAPRDQAGWRWRCGAPTAGGRPPCQARPVPAGARQVRAGRAAKCHGAARRRVTRQAGAGVALRRRTTGDPPARQGQCQPVPVGSELDCSPIRVAPQTEPRASSRPASLDTSQLADIAIRRPSSGARRPVRGYWGWVHTTHPSQYILPPWKARDRFTIRAQAQPVRRRCAAGQGAGGADVLRAGRFRGVAAGRSRAWHGCCFLLRLAALAAPGATPAPGTGQGGYGTGLARAGALRSAPGRARLRLAGRQHFVPSPRHR